MREREEEIGRGQVRSGRAGLPGYDRVRRTAAVVEAAIGKERGGDTEPKRMEDWDLVNRNTSYYGRS